MKKSALTQHLYQQVQWQDLLTLNKVQIAVNLLMPYPFFALSLWFAHQSDFILALVFTLLFFTAGFRQAHDGFHRTLGIGKQGTEWILFILSGIMLTSTHAIKQTHLQHHRHPLADDDIEASFAYLTWYQALYHGLPHWFEVQKTGYQLAKNKGKTEQNKVITDYALIVCFLLIGGTLSLFTQALLYHLLVMGIANSLVGFIAGWAVHHDCDEQVIARTERNPLINLLTFNLLYHMEHHTFPAVPTNNLPKLARRIDGVTRQYADKTVFPKLIIPSSVPTIKPTSRTPQTSRQNTCPIRRLFA